MAGFPNDSAGKEFACNAGDSGSIPGSGITPGGGNGDPFQYSCLKNSMGRGTWQATVHRVAKSWTRLNTPFRASLVVQLVKNLPAIREPWIPSLGWEDPLEKGKEIGGAHV